MIFLCHLVILCVCDPLHRSGILFVLLRTGWAWDIAVDIPNHRSLHVRPVPRVGGWGLLPATLLVVPFYVPCFRRIALRALLLASVPDR